MISSAGSTPRGNSPPWSVIRLSPEGWSLGVPVKTMITPTTRKITRAATLMSANQNSISPKTFTEMRLAATTTATTAKAVTPCGIAATASE
ncbi:Uncharacterised protein [Mycobacteroides abscessus subsp. abscessus]|nr:Uncharacterised protein [Mycobacteroides abscessus subsp. abscessus]